MALVFQGNWNCLRRLRVKIYIDGLVQDCSNSNALAMELLQCGGGGGGGWRGFTPLAWGGGGYSFEGGFMLLIYI